MLAIIAVLTIFLWYMACVHHTEPTEIGVWRDMLTGKTSQGSPGWHITPPWVQVAHIDGRPMRVCVTSAGRGFNCKLVQFVPQYLDTFLNVEGFYYYWLANRVSLNIGDDEQYRGVKNVLRGYAYDIHGYPFVHIMKDLQP